MQTFVHPQGQRVIVGTRLSPGSVIREDDKYSSSDGQWRSAHLIAGGKVPVGNHVLWVRQSRSLSNHGLTLLGYLNLMPWGEKTCIGYRHGAFYVIPSPTFNWDGRYNVEAKRVVHSECVQELVDHGYLVFSEHEVTNWISEYSPVWDGHKNRIYTLTDEGKREGLQLLDQ